MCTKLPLENWRPLCLLYWSWGKKFVPNWSQTIGSGDIAPLCVCVHVCVVACVHSLCPSLCVFALIICMFTYVCVYVDLNNCVLCVFVGGFLCVLASL